MPSKSILLPTGLLIAGVLTATTLASDVKDSHKHAWCENIGFSNWRDAEATASGVEVSDNTLAGWMWFENVGWCSVSAGAIGPSGHDNLTGVDYGVNILPDDRLDGYAWSENTGWLRFDASLDSQVVPRLDRHSGRLRGFAWGENIGWLNLDSDVHFVAIQDSPDFDGDGDVDLSDFAQFSLCFGGANVPPAASCPPGIDADFDDDGDVDLTDFSEFSLAFTGPL